MTRPRHGRAGDGPDSADWQRQWTIDAGSDTLEPVTRRIAQEVIDSLAPSARGQGIGSAAVAALVIRLKTVQGIHEITAVTGAQNTAVS